jgi:hypothetical protein
LFAPGALARAGAAPAEREADRFMRISRVLTGKPDLDVSIGARTLAAMTAHDPQFSAHLLALAERMDGTAAPDMRDFDHTVIAADPALKKAALDIVSAWYLGVVGDGATAELITYEDALMFRPTRDVTAPPATGGGTFGAWSAKPD